LAKEWAVILGASSGFGEATARKLAKSGINIIGVHMDRKQGMAHVGEVQEALKAEGVEVHYFNVNAADPEKQKEVTEEAKKFIGGGRLRVIMHSLAFGALRNFVNNEPKDEIRKDQVAMTIDVMASSLIYWCQELNRAGLIVEGTQIYAMTSAGGSRVWPSYGAVSAAKAALESNIRQLSMELAPKGASANAILAGVTDTPALRKIPGHEIMLEGAANRNPFKRLTTPEDVASLISTFATGLDHSWMTGNTIRVDGGENIVD
jgi:enoyl-[acyl-carrier protein] reductase III